ncbi:hypothetical protein SB861_39630 [Paraburkholderia sp. SIMBA_049]
MQCNRFGVERAGEDHRAIEGNQRRRVPREGGQRLDGDAVGAEVLRVPDVETGSRGHDRLLVLSDVEYVQEIARDAQVLALALKPDQQTLCLDMVNARMVLPFGVDVYTG